MKYFTDENGQMTNPYSYNYVAMKSYREKKANEVKLTPSAEALLTNPTYNFLGKFLGVDNKREWSELYDKVYLLVEWAKRKTKSEDIVKLHDFLKDEINKAPAMNGRRLDDLVIACKIDSYNKEQPEKETKKEDVLEKKEE